MPASQEKVITVQSASSDSTSLTTESIKKLVDEQVTSSLQKALPAILREAMAESERGLASSPPENSRAEEQQQDETKESSVPLSRLARFYTSTKECILSDQVVETIKMAFSKPLSKEVWSDLMDKYPHIKNTEDILVAPTMETGTKEYIRQKFGNYKTKDILVFDEGLVERQAPFLTVARPIATALERLDATGDVDDEGNEAGPEPDEIRSLLEDALVLLGNANIRLNQWRQKRFSEYLTDVGKRTLKAGIPTDKHLFPDQFHKVVQSEHEHSSTNSKLIATPSKPPMTKDQGNKKPFRFFPQNRSDQRSWGKRKWSTKPSSTYGRPSGHNSSFNKASYQKRARVAQESANRS